MGAVSARAEGISIRTLATAAGLSPSRVHQIVADAGLDALDAALGELRAAGWPAPEDPAAMRTPTWTAAIISPTACPLSESSYGRTWHTARGLALGPAAAASALARRPYDPRHAALSLWLNAGAAPAQIARRAGHSITTLLAVCTHCIDGQDDITSRQIERALHAFGIT